MYGNDCYRRVSRIPAIVSFLNRQPALSLVSWNRASCPHCAPCLGQSRSGVETGGRLRLAGASKVSAPNKRRAQRYPSGIFQPQLALCSRRRTHSRRLAPKPIAGPSRMGTVVPRRQRGSAGIRWALTTASRRRPCVGRHDGRSVCPKLTTIPKRPTARTKSSNSATTSCKAVSRYLTPTLPTKRMES